jgi:hypothetical protein
MRTRQHRLGQRSPPPGRDQTCPNRTERGKLGCKHHVIIYQRGLPMVAKLSAAKSMAFGYQVHH